MKPKLKLGRIIALWSKLASWWKSSYRGRTLPAGHNRPASRRKKVPSGFGSYYYLDNILDDLDDYFDALKIMKHVDPDGYDFYSKTGAQVVSRKGLYTVEELPSIWTSGKARPSMGMIHLTGSVANNRKSAEDTDLVSAKFISFQGFTAKPDVEVRSSGNLYEVCLYYRDYELEKIRGKQRSKKGNGTMVRVSFHVCISSDGTIALLKERLVSRHGKRRDIPVTGWKVPDWLVDAAKRKGKTPQEISADIFKVVVGAVEHSASGVQVRVARDGLYALFNVDMLRTPYFFKDRDKTVTVNGTTKKIFHITRAHRRITAGGRETYVRSHFRGERRFTWNNYRVTISMPSLHHSIFQRFDGRAIAEVDPTNEPPAGTINTKTLGKMMARHLDK